MNDVKYHYIVKNCFDDSKGRVYEYCPTIEEFTFDIPGEIYLVHKVPENQYCYDRLHPKGNVHCTTGYNKIKNTWIPEKFSGFLDMKHFDYLKDLDERTKKELADMLESL